MVAIGGNSNAALYGGRFEVFEEETVAAAELVATSGREIDDWGEYTAGVA